MKDTTFHNIICLEAEWEYSQEADNTFSLNTLPMLNWLKESYECKIVYRRIRTKADLKYYLDYFFRNKEEFGEYDIIYIACHGEKKGLWIEGSAIPFPALAKMAKGFFKDKIVHFSSCRTVSNKLATKKIKYETGAVMVCGYKTAVEPKESSIADIALMNDLLLYDEFDISRYTDREGEFWKRYSSLLGELKFEAI